MVSQHFDVFVDFIKSELVAETSSAREKFLS